MVGFHVWRIPAFERSYIWTLLTERLHKIPRGIFMASGFRYTFDVLFRTCYMAFEESNPSVIYYNAKCYNDTLLPISCFELPGEVTHELPLIVTSGRIPRARGIFPCLTQLHILIGQLKIKDISILLDPRKRNRLRKRHKALKINMSAIPSLPHHRTQKLTFCKLHRNKTCAAVFPLYVSTNPFNTGFSNL